MTTLEILTRLDACDPSKDWADAHPDPEEAWSSCERGNWLLWTAAKVGVDRRLVVRAACACARIALVHVPPGEDRPRRAIETAERWCDGLASLEEVCEAALAAWDAADDADKAVFSDRAAEAAAYAARASSYAARAASYAARADAVADAVAVYVAYAVYAARASAAFIDANRASAAFAGFDTDAHTYADAYAAALKRQAVLVRRVISWDQVKSAPKTPAL